MAISRIPGVGPTNSDIAATIATTPAVSAQITANVPTAAAIATAVAAPSLAQITTAITSNAASAGVTNASIATQVANNASPYGGTITNLGVTSVSGTGTITFSSLSSYKYLKFFMGLNTISPTTLRMRFNGDSGSSYRFATAVDRGGISSLQSLGLGPMFELDPASSNNIRWWSIEIPMSNAGEYKTYMAYGYGTTDGAAPGIGYSHGVWNSTAAISSVTFLTGTGNFDSGAIYGIGAA